MTYNRRLFLKSAGAAAAGSLVLTLGACGGSKDKSSESTDSAGVASTEGAGIPSIPDFGLQLYSVRDIIGPDPKGVLKQIAGLGYKKIESYANYWNINTI